MIVTSVQIKTVKTQKHLYCPVFTHTNNPNTFLMGDAFGFFVSVEYPNFNAEKQKKLNLFSPHPYNLPTACETASVGISPPRLNLFPYRVYIQCRTVF